MTALLPCAKHGTAPKWHSRTEKYVCQECLNDAWVRRRAKHKLDERARAEAEWNDKQRKTKP